MSLALLFQYLILNMFRMLVHPSSGACDLFVELPHHPSRTTPQHQHISNQSNTTHEITQQISRKLLRMDELTFETCWALNNEIIKRLTSSSLFNYQDDARSNKHKILQMVNAAYGDQALSHSSVFRWYGWFRDGREDIGNDDFRILVRRPRWWFFFSIGKA